MPDRTKILFLDLDGPLNNEVFPNAFFAICKQVELKNEEAHALHGIVMRDDYGNLFCPTATNMLAHIIEKTQASIVISSTWRGSGLKAMQDMWKSRGLPGEVIDITPFYDKRGEFSHLPFKHRAERGNEIAIWLKDHPEVTSYVIIDDDSDMLPEQEQFFVQVNDRYGITFEDAQRCITILDTLTRVPKDFLKDVSHGNGTQ